MKQKFLKLIYLRYRDYFYMFFTEEFLEEIPKSVREPSMTFLAQGKDKIEKWAMYQAHYLQSRMVTDVRRITLYEGMMLMLKLILVHVRQPQKITAIVGREEDGIKSDPVKDVEDAIKKYKENDR